MSAWIPISERMPTHEDASERGEVVWRFWDGTTFVARFDDKIFFDFLPSAWMPIPPYTPPKPGPTDEECAAFAFILDCITSRDQLSVEARRWFVDVTARIEREKGEMSTACYKCSYPYCHGHTAPYMICGGSSANTIEWVATLPAPQLTEADVRRIVREELARTPPT